MRKDWSIYKLGDLCTFVRGPFGGSLKKDCFKSEGVAVYEQQHAIYDQFEEIRYFVDDDKFEEMKRFELFAGDLIMSCSGTMGKVAIVPEGIQKGIINQALLKLTPKENLNVEYLRYWMSSLSFQESISKYSKGAAIKNVASVKILKQIELPTPHLEEQKQIVAILDQAFAAIDQAQANIQQNIQNAQDLFQSKLNQIFSQQGEGWEEKSLKYICELKNGYAFKSKEFTEVGIRLLRNCNVLHGTVDWSKPAYYPSESLDEFKRFELFEGDIVLSLDRPIISSGLKLARVRAIDLPCLLLQRVLCIRSDSTNNDYIFHFMSSPNFINEINPGKSLGVPHISLSEVGAIKVSVPSLEMQLQLVEIINNLRLSTEKLISSYQEKLKSIEELKKSLLQKAFNGELTQTQRAA